MSSNAVAGSPVALVVETNNSVRRLTATILRQKAFHVIEARNEDEGEELFMTSPEPVSLLLAGYDNSSSESGLTLALRLRELRLDLRILLFGAFAPGVSQSFTMRLAGIHFLSMPFSFGRFSQALGILHPDSVGVPALVSWISVPVAAASAQQRMGV